MFDLCYPTNTLCHLAKYKVKKTSNAKHRQKRERKNGTTNQSKPARGIYTGNAFFIRDTRHVGTIVGFVKVNCTLHVEWPLGGGGGGIEWKESRPLCVRLPSPVHCRTHESGSKGSYVGLARPSAQGEPCLGTDTETTADSGTMGLGIPCFLSGNKVRRNKRGGNVDSFSILTRCLPRPLSSKWEQVDFESLEIVDAFSNTCVSIVYFN